MNRLKNRMLAAAMAAVLSAGLAACGSSDSSNDESKAAGDTSSAAAESTAESTAAGNGESTPAGGDTTAPADSSQAEEIVTKATKPASEIIAELPADEAKSVKLKEVGKFKQGDIVFYGDFLYKVKDKDKETIQVLDYLGKEFSDKNACYVDKLGETGLYAYQIDGGDILYEGLCDAQGNIIIDGNEKVGMFDEIDGRFIKAYIPDKVTTNKNEAIYYATSRQWSVEVGEEDVMYTGTVKVYDTVQKKFLESTAQNFDPRYQIHGDIISFYDADNKIVNISVETDSVLDLGTKEPIGKSILGEYKDSKYYCYDHSGELLFVTPYTVSEFDSESEFLSCYDSATGMRGVIHESGTVMIEPKYKTVTQLGNGYFSYYNDDFSKMGLVRADGSEVLPCENKNISDIKTPGFFSVQRTDGKYSLVDVSGKEIVGGQDSGFTEGSYIKEGDTCKFLVLSKGDMSLQLESSGNYLGNFLIYDYKSNTLYDLVTGEKLIEKADKVYTAYGYVYVLKNKEFTVYEIEK